MIKYLFQSIIHIIHPRFSDTGSKLNSVQVCHQAHSNKMWVMKFILKTDEGWELNFVVILSLKMRSNLDHRHESVTSNLRITKKDSLTLNKLADVET